MAVRNCLLLPIWIPFAVFLFLEMFALEVCLRTPQFFLILLTCCVYVWAGSEPSHPMPYFLILLLQSIALGHDMLFIMLFHDSCHAQVMKWRDDPASLAEDQLARSRRCADLDDSSPPVSYGGLARFATISFFANWLLRILHIVIAALYFLAVGGNCAELCTCGASAEDAEHAPPRDEERVGEYNNYVSQPPPESIKSPNQSLETPNQSPNRSPNQSKKENRISIKRAENAYSGNPTKDSNQPDDKIKEESDKESYSSKTYSSEA